MNWICSALTLLSSFLFQNFKDCLKNDKGGKEADWLKHDDFFPIKNHHKMEKVLCNTINGSCTRDELSYPTSQQAEYLLLLMKRKRKKLNKSQLKFF